MILMIDGNCYFLAYLKVNKKEIPILVSISSSSGINI